MVLSAFSLFRSTYQIRDLGFIFADSLDDNLRLEKSLLCSAKNWFANECHGYCSKTPPSLSRTPKLGVRLVSEVQMTSSWKSG